MRSPKSIRVLAEIYGRVCIVGLNFCSGFADVCFSDAVHVFMLIASVVSDPLGPMDCSPLGSSVHGMLWARIPEWVAISSPRDLPHSGIEPSSLESPILTGGFLNH